MAIKNNLCIKVMMLFGFYLKAQSTDLSEELVEQITDETRELVSGTEMPQQYLLETLRIKNLNKANHADLQRIYWLTSHQIQNLIDYIKHYGPLVSIYELQAVPGWDLATIRRTKLFIEIPESGSYYDPRKMSERINQDGGASFLLRLKRRFPLSSGFQTNMASNFRGSPVYWLARFRYRQKGKIDCGLSSEKDPGERFTWKPNSGFYGGDHVSTFIQLENKGALKKLLVGDFQAQWDQGLVLGAGLTFQKQVITGPRKVHLGIMPHTGTREYDYYRGIGIEFQSRGFLISSIVSYRKLDAQILEPDSVDILSRRVPSILKTGLHRTPLELSRRGQLPELLLGMHVSRSWSRKLATSISSAIRRFGVPLIPTPTLHNAIAFTGKHNLNYSGNIEYQLNNMNLFGQVAFSNNRAWAAIAGLIGSLSHKVSMTLLVRNYHKEYHSISSNAYGVVTGNTNEQGIYWGFQFAPSPKWSFGSSTDFYRLPFATFSSDVSNHGHQQLIRIQFKPTKNGYLDFYWRNRKKLVNHKTNSTKLTYDLSQTSKHSFGLRGSWENNAHISVQSRIQYSRYQRSDISSSGTIASNQVSYNAKTMRITLGMAHFNTDDFENRQYIYEKDLPHGLSIQFFYGVGTRWFCLVQLRFVQNLDFWFKIAQTTRHDSTQQGSGLDTTLGPRRTDMSMQIRYKL
jgi:hypothetical protein